MDIAVILMGIMPLIVIFVLFSIFVNGFQKCPPNTALIVFGAGGRTAKVVKGGGTYVMPLIQAARPLSLEIMTMDVKSAMPYQTRNGVPLFVDAVAQIKVASDDESILTAAEVFLSKSAEEVMSIAHDTMTGHIRSVLGTLTVEELIKGVDSFCRSVQQETNADYHKMGLVVVSFTVREIRDSVGYLEQLGRVQAARAKQEADNAIARLIKQSEAGNGTTETT
jgi:flotillin